MQEISSRAFSNSWNYARSGEARPFDSWILKFEFISKSRAVIITSIVDMRLSEVSLLVLAGKRSKLFGCVKDRNGEPERGGVNGSR
jgi:hypothetical protein